MSLVVQIPRTNSACLFINVDSVDELAKLPEDMFSSRIYETFGYIASMFAYRELYDAGKIDSSILDGMLKIESQGLYEEGFEDPHNFDETMRTLIDSDEFKERNKLIFDGIMKELISLFVTGALASTLDESEEEIMLLDRLIIPPPRFEA